MNLFRKCNFSYLASAAWVPWTSDAWWTPAHSAREVIRAGQEPPAADLLYQKTTALNRSSVTWDKPAPFSCPVLLQTNLLCSHSVNRFVKTTQLKYQPCESPADHFPSTGHHTVTVQRCLSQSEGGEAQTRELGGRNIYVGGGTRTGGPLLSVVVLAQSFDHPNCERPPLLQLQDPSMDPCAVVPCRRA